MQNNTLFLHLRTDTWIQYVQSLYKVTRSIWYQLISCFVRNIYEKMCADPDEL